MSKSPFYNASPTRLCQATRINYATASPICGTSTSTRISLLHRLKYRAADSRFIRNHRALQHR